MNAKKKLLIDRRTEKGEFIGHRLQNVHPMLVPKFVEKNRNKNINENEMCQFGFR